MRRAAEAKTLRRETPVQHYREDGTLIEGVVDLAFAEGSPEFNGWTVVDFKTDREVEKAKDQYRAMWRLRRRSPTRNWIRGTRFLLVV